VEEAQGADRATPVAARAEAGSNVSPVFLAEHYLPDVNRESMDALTERLEAAAAELRREGADVTLVGFAGLPDDEAVLVVLAAPSADVAARALEAAEVVADRIVPAVWRAGDGAASVAQLRS
jgi:hypothetical protein